MPLVTQRPAVLEVYAKAAEKKWVVPTFCTENLTTTEAVLEATLAYSREINMPDLPITLAITNQYPHRSQSRNYTHTDRWDIGLKLFLADIDVLTSEGSPYEKLTVMTHLDHTQWDRDADLLTWDLNRFSMIMYDASGLPFGQNIQKTAEFVRRCGAQIVVEGACDEIVDATGNAISQLTTPEKAQTYLLQTGADFIVANLGTEHRANAANLKYQHTLAQAISKITGPKLVLHGTSSVTRDQLTTLFADGIAKVNIWTCLERDSAPVLFAEMVKNAAKIIGRKEAGSLLEAGLLGRNIDVASEPCLSHYTTVYRQRIIFNVMKAIVLDYLKLWYR